RQIARHGFSLRPGVRSQAKRVEALGSSRPRRWDRPFPRTGCNLPCVLDPTEGHYRAQPSAASKNSARPTTEIRTLRSGLDRLLLVPVVFRATASAAAFAFFLLA